jgi:glycine oxidase
VVVGATVEERGEDTAVTAGGLTDLLRDARRVVPAVAELAVAETTAGLRPGSPDNAPVIGVPRGLSGLVVATGHFRNGLLLTPITADAVAAVCLGGVPPPETEPFTPDRFAPSPSGGRRWQTGT